MSWDQFKKGQEVRFRALGGWVRGHISETYGNSVSVMFNRGAQQRNIRVYDLRNIEPCHAKEKRNSTSPENPSFDL
jgi:hypothetical protein